MNNLDWLYIFLAEFLIYLLILAAILLTLTRHRRIALTGMLAGFLAGTFSDLIKDFFFIPRPFITSGQLPLIELIMDGSFPSSHTAVSFALGFSFFTKTRPIGIFFITLAILVAIGRVGSGVHTFPDLAGGIIIALISTFLAKILDKNIKKDPFQGLTNYHS